MQPDYDPAHGELRELIGHLTSLEAEMIANDLRDLRIPAIVRQGVAPGAVPEEDRARMVPVRASGSGFEVVVPEAFLEIANEVLDVTHLRREGDATDAEIARELATGTADDRGADRPTADGTDDRRALVALRVGLVSIPVVLAILWQLLGG